MALNKQGRGTLAANSIQKLLELMMYLRGPEGCPWDREQTYSSLKALLLEEAYEVVDAVTTGDFDAIEDELGDLLFQVVFYSQLAAEEGRFDFGSVAERVHAKLVRRHPHVFGETRARTAEEALRSWTSVKEKEREAKGESRTDGDSVLDGIGLGLTLPSTLEAYKLGLRAAEVGFDWQTIKALLDKVEEELGELRRELAEHSEKNQQRVEEEVGDLLFTVANLARHAGSDPETCLRAANQKFKRRFRELEREAARHGKTPRDSTPEELESFWELLKDRESH